MGIFGQGKCTIDINWKMVLENRDSQALDHETKR